MINESPIEFDAKLLRQVTDEKKKELNRPNFSTMTEEFLKEASKILMEKAEEGECSHKFHITDEDILRDLPKIVEEFKKQGFNASFYYDYAKHDHTKLSVDYDTMYVRVPTRYGDVLYARFLEVGW